MEDTPIENNTDKKQTLQLHPTEHQLPPPPTTDILPPYLRTQSTPKQNRHPSCCLCQATAAPQARLVDCCFKLSSFPPLARQPERVTVLLGLVVAMHRCLNTEHISLLGGLPLPLPLPIRRHLQPFSHSSPKLKPMQENEFHTKKRLPGMISKDKSDNVLLLTFPSHNPPSSHIQPPWRDIITTPTNTVTTNDTSTSTDMADCCV
jgi:hypothetical protein